MLHNEMFTKMDYENIIYSIAPNQNFHLLGLFKNKHSKDLKFPTLFYGQPRQFFEGFSYQQIIHGNYFINLGFFQQIFQTFF
jgi:hypothetical protein